VASYSKLFSIARPEAYAIYDARVAACLNAVQINGGIRRGIAFNCLPGRNNVVGNTVTKRGNWVLIKRDETYSRYLDLLETCRAKLPGYDLPRLEMALFANAEAECQRAMDRNWAGLG